MDTIIQQCRPLDLGFAIFLIGKELIGKELIGKEHGGDPIIDR